MNTTEINKQIFYKPIPGNLPEVVADTTKDPYKFVGLLVLTFPNNKTYIGTGTIIAKDQEKESCYVLTCAHNLYDPEDGGNVVKVEFLRAFSDTEKPVDRMKAIAWHYPDGYPEVAIAKSVDISLLGPAILEKNINLDYALVILGETIKAEDKLPIVKVKPTDELQDLKVQINGYGYYGTRMSHAEGKITEVGDLYLRYPISTRKGASGSGIMLENGVDIVGVHTREANFVDLNQGVRITASVYEDICRWMTE